MADAGRRGLERQAATGDPEATERLQRVRERDVSAVPEPRPEPVFALDRPFCGRCGGGADHLRVNATVDVPISAGHPGSKIRWQRATRWPEQVRDWDGLERDAPPVFARQCEHSNVEIRNGDPFEGDVLAEGALAVTALCHGNHRWETTLRPYYPNDPPAEGDDEPTDYGTPDGLAPF